ncbi:MAG: DUF1491 family protein [Albidovulum sp.]|nr:DUF1491 family protein [Albidovulum sp.]MDE0307188.1 DUF1491 family protein [Albidovulum sp.]MDE0531916.1 DUF1491 family protein [Albidovulum sp.]
MCRLASDLWVSAYLARLGLAGIPAYVVSKGHEKAGAVLVKVNSLDGCATVYQRTYDFEADSRIWVVLCQGKEKQVDEVLERQMSSDPDLWIIEVEDRNSNHLLDEEGLRD